MKLILVVLKLTHTSWPFLVLVLLLGGVSSFFTIFPYEIIRTLIDSLNESPSISYITEFHSFSGQLLGLDINLSVFLIFLYLISSILTVITRNLYGFSTTIITDNIIRKIRNLVYQKVLKMPYSFFMRNDKGKILYTTVNDTQRLELVFSQPMYTLLSDVVDLIWITVFLISIYPKALVILAVGVPIIYFLSIRTAKRQRNISRKIQDNESSLTSYLRQVLGAVDSVKSLNAEKNEAKKFDAVTRKIYKYNVQAAKSLSLFFPLEGIVRFTTIFTILLLAFSDYQSNLISAGSFAIIYFYAVKFYAPISNMNKYYQILQNGLASAERVYGLLKLEEEKHIGGHVCPQKDAFDISVKNAALLIEGGEKIDLGTFRIDNKGLCLIKGESGSGKTSFLKALLKFVDYEGSIKLNGIEIKDYHFEQLRAYFGYCSQFPFILTGSYLENIQYPNTCIDTTQLDSISSQLGLADKFRDVSMELNEDTISGGERRRIGFIRSIFGNNSVLLLDEITSNLDEVTESKLIKLLSQLKRPVIVTTHSNHADFEKSAAKIIQL